MTASSGPSTRAELEAPADIASGPSRRGSQADSRPVFWILAVLSSLIEPATDLDGLRVGASLAIVGAQLVPDLLLNLTQVVMFRRYGFFASIVTRVAMYLIWHVAYGNFVCGC